MCINYDGIRNATLRAWLVCLNGRGRFRDSVLFLR